MVAAPRQRLDTIMVARGLAESRAVAQALIMAGHVAVAGKAAVKPGSLVPADVVINVAEPRKYVGRGGLKLEAALEVFKLEVTGQVALDIGASTGGFTDCLLKAGAGRVYAVDAGYGQLDYRLRRDRRVVVMERTNARYPLPLPEPVDIISIDVSFISLRKILPPAVAHLSPQGRIVAVSYTHLTLPTN